MSEKELDEILNEVRKKANSSVHIDPPIRSSNGRVRRVNGTPDIPQAPDAAFDLDSFNVIYTSDTGSERPRRSAQSGRGKKKKKSRGAVIALIVLILIAAVCTAAYFLFFTGDKGETDTPQQNVAENAKILNPLTGEEGYNTSAVGKRPVCVVVENEYGTEAVRPQWGIGAADIVLEGESEYSTRMLLIWADYTDVPDMVGPIRSARPPFIRFSQLFDGVFMHAGLSQSKGNYVGADTVFETEGVDHINLLEFSDDGTYFGRNNERYTAIEHTGYMNGSNLPQLFEEKNIRTSVSLSDFTELSFNEQAAALSDLIATGCAFRWSGSYCPKVAEFTYNSTTHKYSTGDYDSQYGQANVQFENLIFLFDETEYIVKENYGGSGSSETYCDYKLSGGSGTILSEDTAVEITWGVSDGKLWMKTGDGKDAVLNPGEKLHRLRLFQ